MDKVQDKRDWHFTMLDNAVVYSSALNSFEKLVYVILCAYANVRTGECYPSIKTISELICASQNTVRKSLKSLQEKKLISIENRKNGQLNFSNLYTLLNMPTWIVQEYENYKNSTSPDEVGVLHEMKEGTSPDEGGVLHEMKEGTSPGEDELYPINNTKLNNTNITIYIEVINYLNQRAGTKYRPTIKKTRSLIQARVKEGFKLEDFYTVIDKKCSDWLKTEFAKYLRPETLFGPKFENYLNQKIVDKQINNKTDSFNNYQQREYDFNDLENKLLGRNN